MAWASGKNEIQKWKMKYKNGKKWNTNFNCCSETLETPLCKAVSQDKAAGVVVTCLWNNHQVLSPQLEGDEEGRWWHLAKGSSQPVEILKEISHGRRGWSCRAPSRAAATACCLSPAGRVISWAVGMQLSRGKATECISPVLERESKIRIYGKAFFFFYLSPGELALSRKGFRSGEIKQL